VYGGAAAFSRAAEELHSDPSDAFAELLTHFALPLGARRCMDAAGFLALVGRSTAACLMEEKAEAFGEAQYHCVRQDWKRAAEVFQHLAKVEDKLRSSYGPTAAAV